MLLPADSPIANVIVGEIQQTGPISLARFMGLALYSPNLGYYERLPNRIGKSGDYFTSVSTGTLFGELLSRQFSDWLPQIPPGNTGYNLLESGAHDGKLAFDILTSLERSQPALFRDITYDIVEPSQPRREWQRSQLARFANQIRWFSSWEELPKRGFSGVIFANELLDAFPLHQFRWDRVRSEWEEWGVGCRGRQLIWEPLAQLEASAPTLPEELLALLPDGFCLESSPSAVDWWQQAARHLNHGYLLTLDYGYLDPEWWGCPRPNGSLRAFRNHALQNDPFLFPGECDLTADVNFSRLIEAGEAEQLSTLYLTTQGRWLTGIARKRIRREHANVDWPAAQQRQFHTLTHPQQMGERFRVLVQATPGLKEDSSGSTG